MDFDRNYYENLPLAFMLQHAERVSNKSELMHAMIRVLETYDADETANAQRVQDLAAQLDDSQTEKYELQTEIKKLKEIYEQQKARREEQIHAETATIGKIDFIFHSLKEQGLITND